MTFLGTLLVIAFAAQAGGVVMVVVAAFRFDRRGHRPGLGYLVWGGVAVTCTGTAILLVALFLAAATAAVRT